MRRELNVKCKISRVVFPRKNFKLKYVTETSDIRYTYVKIYCYILYLVTLFIIWFKN